MAPTKNKIYRFYSKYAFCIIDNKYELLARYQKANSLQPHDSWQMSVNINNS